MSTDTHLPPLPSRPLPPLPEITVFLGEHRETVFAFAGGEDALAATMHREIERRFKEVLDA
jgi:hypothetical protein